MPIAGLRLEGPAEQAAWQLSRMGAICIGKIGGTAFNNAAITVELPIEYRLVDLLAARH